MQDKNSLQQEIVKYWLEYKPKKGTILLPTGVGKTKVACDILRNLYDTGEIHSALVVVPTHNLKHQWAIELSLWGLGPYVNSISIKVKNTASKDTVTPYDIIIVDEIHTALSTEHGKVLDIPCNYLLGLTAKLPHSEEAKDIIELKAPVLYEKRLMELVGAGIVPEFNMYNLSVSLNRSERARYKIFDSLFNRAKIALRSYLKQIDQKGWTEFDVANEARLNKTHPMYKPSQSFWSGMSMRKWICYRAENKIDTVISIIKKFPDKKWIVFSKEIAFVDNLNVKLNMEHNIASVCYHSKQEKDTKVEMLRLAREPETKVIVSAEALTTGYDLPDLDAAICASGVSTEILQVQMLGQFGPYPFNSVKPKSKDMAIPSEALNRERVENIPFVGEYENN